MSYLSEPVLVSIYKFEYDISVSTIEIRGKIYSLMTSRFSGLEIIDISDRSKPVLDGSKWKILCIDSSYG